MRACAREDGKWVISRGLGAVVVMVVLLVIRRDEWWEVVLVMARKMARKGQDVVKVAG